MIALFVVTLVIIFVYEYEVLRRPKAQTYLAGDFLDCGPIFQLQVNVPVLDI